MIRDEFSRPYSNGAKDGAVEIHWESRIAWCSEYAPPVAPGTVSDDTRVWQNVTPRAEQVSFCRIWADFRDAAFELARQNREKEQAFFAQNSPFVQCFMGDFYFLRQSGPEILPPGRKNPGPEKEIPGSENKIPSPEIFFPGPVFFRRRLGSTFSRYLELFHRQIPGVNMSVQVPPGLRAPVIPARKQLYRQQKESLRPLFADIWVSARSARLRFLRPPPPLPRISESQGPSNDKVSNPRANNKMSNPSQRISGEA